MCHGLRPRAFVAAKSGGKDGQRQYEHGGTHSGGPQGHIEGQGSVRALAEEVAGGVEPDKAERQHKGQ